MKFNKPKGVKKHLSQKQLKENWHQPETTYTFHQDVFLRHPDDDGVIEGDTYLNHPEYVFKKDSKWKIYWPITDLNSGFIGLIHEHEIRIVLQEDIDSHIKNNDISIDTQETSTKLKFSKN